MSVLVSGVLAVDDIMLPSTRLEKVAGGAVLYAGLASSIFANTSMLSAVGNDFPDETLRLLRNRENLDTTMLSSIDDRSFRWKAYYSGDLDSVTTTHMSENLFEKFDFVSVFKSRNKVFDVVFISNFNPEQQLQLIKALPSHTIKIYDSMDIWIGTKSSVVREILRNIDVLFISDNEASSLLGRVGTRSEYIEDIMRFGPKVVIFKQGRFGLTMYGQFGVVSFPSYALVNVVDPSGAGDSLGGSVAGVLSSIGRFDRSALITALTFGSTVASFVIEGLTIDRLKDITKNEVINRSKIFINQLPTKSDILWDSI